jgi:hypothetical protein
VRCIVASRLRVVVLMALLGGCIGRVGATPRYAPTDQSLPAGTQQRWDFDAIADGELPAGVEVVSGSWG